EHSRGACLRDLRSSTLDPRSSILLPHTPEGVLMVLLRRCAAGLLCAAGALSLASPAQAQPPRAARPLPLVGAPQVTPRQVRLGAMKVEMAWLADPATYSLPLEVQAHGDGLRASGRVPDDASRQQALEVARQASCLPVADGLTV